VTQHLLVPAQETGESLGFLFEKFLSIEYDYFFVWGSRLDPVG
jgi:hypothetical protein